MYAKMKFQYRTADCEMYSVLYVLERKGLYIKTARRGENTCQIQSHPSYLIYHRSIYLRISPVFVCTSNNINLYSKSKTTFLEVNSYEIQRNPAHLGHLSTTSSEETVSSNRLGSVAVNSI
jgi:hypothetical protein